MFRKTIGIELLQKYQFNKDYVLYNKVIDVNAKKPRQTIKNLSGLIICLPHSHFSYP